MGELVIVVIVCKIEFNAKSKCNHMMSYQMISQSMI
jgi:hypothetical protein